MKKQWLLLLLLVVILITSTVSLLPKYQKMQIQKASAFEQGEYLLRLKTAVNDLTAESSAAEALYWAQLSAWQSTLNQQPVDKRYFTDPQEAVAFVRHSYQRDGSIERLEGEKARLDKLFQELRLPPAEYEKEYEVALRLYLNYKEFVSLALKPQGTQQNYQSRFDDLRLKIAKDADEFYRTTHS